MQESGKAQEHGEAYALPHGAKCCDCNRAARGMAAVSEGSYGYRLKTGQGQVGFVPVPMFSLS
jgi:hypothetical protein